MLVIMGDAIFVHTRIPLILLGLSLQGERVESVRKGSIKNIEVKMDDKFGGRKHATKLSHLESFAHKTEDISSA